MTGEESTGNESSGSALVNTVVNTSLTALVGLTDKIVETDGKTVASVERSPAVATETTAVEAPG